MTEENQENKQARLEQIAHELTEQIDTLVQRYEAVVTENTSLKKENVMLREQTETASSGQTATETKLNDLLMKVSAVVSAQSAQTADNDQTVIQL